MHTPLQQRDLDIAILAARTAGQVVVDGYRIAHKLKYKGIGDVVTEVDTLCDTKIHAVLKKSFPEDRILSEELASDVCDDGSRLWVVDPLDATSGFVHRMGNMVPSVMIALREHMMTQLAVIYFPLEDVMYHARAGHGAYRDGERIDLGKKASMPLHKGRVDMNQYGDARLETDDFRRIDTALRSGVGAGLVTRSVPHSGIVATLLDPDSTLLAVVHDNNPQKTKQEAWDKIPAQLILEEAGGSMINWRLKAIDPYIPELFVAAVSETMAKEILKLGRSTRWDDTIRRWQLT